jgi:hypothetical protein
MLPRAGGTAQGIGRNVEAMSLGGRDYGTVRA